VAKFALKSLLKLIGIEKSSFSVIAIYSLAHYTISYEYTRVLLAMF